MREERALDFDRAEAVRGDLDDLVGAAAEPEVAVLVDVRRVAGVVDAGDLAPSSRGRSAPARPTAPASARERPLEHHDALLVRRARLRRRA